MECEWVQVQVPRGFIKDGFRLVIGEVAEGDVVVKHLCETLYGENIRLIWRPIATEPPKPVRQLKPDWKPPKLKKGWLTWDITGGWWWWSGRPCHTGNFGGWVHSESRCSDGGKPIREVMAELLGCPDCRGFDERECIWEVGR
jgi:hypothetical protein